MIRIRMSGRKQRVLPLAISEGLETIPYLSLGMLVAYARGHADGALNRVYDIDRVRPVGFDAFPIDDAYDEVARAGDPICLFSLYVWNHEINLRAARHIKEAHPNALIVFGGPDVPRNVGDTEAYMEEHSFIDIAVLGEGELAFADVLERLDGRGLQGLSDLADVASLVYRDGERLVRTAANRPRVKDLASLPSPYLTDEFEPWFSQINHAILETNRGCPYGCVYCDWGSATLQKITRFTAERVAKEVEYLARNEVQSVFIADANFGVLEQDVEISHHLVKTFQSTGYPAQVVTNFAKSGGKHLMASVKILHEGGLLPVGIVAFQTTDTNVLKTIKRQNIKTGAYEKMMRFFNEENIPISADIMIGLPGQNRDALEHDFQFCFDWKVTANGFLTTMMPNAPMADASYREKHKIEVGEDRIIKSTATATPEDIEYMVALYYAYQFHLKVPISKYFLYFLQADHGVPASALIRRWLDAAIADDPATPLASRVYRSIFKLEERNPHYLIIRWAGNARFLFRDPEAFYEEFLGLAEREFGVRLTSSEKHAMIQAQAAVMPRLRRQYPMKVELEHDFVAYFSQIDRVATLRDPELDIKPLREFQPGTLTVGDEHTFFKHLRFFRFIKHGEMGWEIESCLTRRSEGRTAPKGGLGPAQVGSALSP